MSDYSAIDFLFSKISEEEQKRLKENDTYLTAKSIEQKAFKRQYRMGFRMGFNDSNEKALNAIKDAYSKISEL
jgi:hypothetical protein